MGGKSLYKRDQTNRPFFEYLLDPSLLLVAEQTHRDQHANEAGVLKQSLCMDSVYPLLLRVNTTRILLRALDS